MKTQLSITYFAVGLLIASALNQFATIQPMHTLIAAAVITGISLLFLFINKINNSNNTRSSNQVQSSKNTVNGKVKWFNKAKGFGFITQADGEDIFVHQTAIKFKPNILREGQRVTMSVIMDEKGPQAENVRKA